ncbi:WD40-repeat-containing domain protein [Phlebopus sp. FC_14]|nr:WD40-repeat-containing domain protein [Phlebopus sp. FC_14]
MPNEPRNRFRKILDGLFRHRSNTSHDDRLSKPRWWKRSALVQRAQVTAQPHPPGLSAPGNATQRSGDLACKPIAVLSGHTGIVRGIAWFPDGKRVASCSDDRAIRIWRMDGGRAKILVESDLHTSIAMFPKGDKIVSGCIDGKVKVLDSKSGRLLHEGAGRNGEVLCVAVSPNGQFLASGGRDGRIVIRETKHGSIHRVLGKEDWSSAVFKLAFSPDGRRIASAHSQAKFQAFDIDTGKIIFGPKKHDYELAYDVRGLVWSLDGHQLITACDNTIQKWDVEAQVAVEETPRRYGSWISSISLSPDGTRLACASGKNVLFSDLYSFEQIDEPLQHDGLVMTVAFSPNGDFIASGGWDKKISIWSASRDADPLSKSKPGTVDASATAKLGERPKMTEVSSTQSAAEVKIGGLSDSSAPAKSSPSRSIPSQKYFRGSENGGLYGLRPGDWW